MKEQRGSHALRLFFNLQRAANDLTKLAEMVAEAQTRAASLNGPLWQALLPLVNRPAHIDITADALSLLFDTATIDLFNRVRDVEMTHKSAVESWGIYAEKRSLLAMQLPADIVAGRGTSELNGDEYRKLAPLMAEVGSTADWIGSRASQDAKHAIDTLAAYVVPLKNLTGKAVDVQVG